MAFQLLQDCIDMDVVMSASTHAVLVVLCRHANDAGECFPSTAVISKKTHLNPRTVMQAVKELEQSAWISSTQEPGKKRRFLIDAAKIKSFVTPVETCTTVETGTPVETCTTVENYSTPLQEVTGDPCRKLQGTPAGNCTRIKHIKEQLKDQRKNQFSLLAASRSPFGDVVPKKAKRPVTYAFNIDALPDQWRALCKQTRPDLDADRIFMEFKFYWTQGKGQGTLRSDKGWAQSWANWIKRQKEQRVAQTNGKAPLPPHKDPAFHFSKEYYDKSVNPDGTTNWGV